MKTLKIALIQNKIFRNDKLKNFDVISKYICQAKKKKADICILPELSFTGYIRSLTKNASETIPGKSSNFMKRLSIKHQIAIIGGITEKNNSKFPYNTCIVFNHGNLISKYRKIHAFSFANEDKYFSQGKDITTFKIKNFNCCTLICYDLRFPELFRNVAKEVDIFFIIANWPKPRKEHWLCLLRARAIENQCYIVAVNRVGKNDKHQYFGCSRIFDPYGDTIVSSPVDKQLVSYGNVSKLKIQKIRSKYPFLNDMKIKHLKQK